MSVEAKKLIDLTRLSRFKELMDQSVDGKLSKLKIDFVQVNLGKYSYLSLYKNPNAGQPLPGHDVGSVPDSADYVRNDL